MNQFDHVRVASGLIEASIREKLAAAETLEEKFRIAFVEAKDYWMSTDDDVRFKGGIGAVMMTVIDTPEYDRIVTELDQIKALSAMLDGVPVRIEELPMPEGFEPIGIMKLWQEIAH